MARLAAPKVVRFVPPLAVGKVPVTPVVSGKPVTFVIVPDAGVPSAGVTSVGELARTTFPVPVDEVKVGDCACVPVPVEVTNCGVVVVLPASNPTALVPLP